MHAENRKKAEEIKERVQQDMTQARLRGFGKALLYTETQVFNSENFFLIFLKFS